MTLTEAADWLAMLKAAGVSKASFEGMYVDFLPVRAVDKSPDVPKQGLLPEARCLCGHHPDVEHGDEGLCLMGCSPTLCNPLADDSGK